MSRYIKSVTDSKQLLNSMEDLKTQVQQSKEATQRNNKELSYINEVAKTVHEDKIMKLEKELREIKENTKWVENEKPAIDYSNDHLMKKLNIL